MNADYLQLSNSLQASNELLSDAYPKCEQILERVAKLGGVAMIGVSLTFTPILKAGSYNMSKPSFLKVAHANELENANTFWMVTGTSNLSADLQPMILDRNLSQVEKSLHGINGSAKPLLAFEGELKKGTPLDVRFI